MMTRILGELKNSSQEDKEPKKYECDICKDEEWIYIKDEFGLYSTARPCKCREAKLYKKIIESSGITEAFLQKNFENYNITNKQTETALKVAKDYASTYELIKDTKNNSIALLGQVGSGKTHLTIAIANELMKDNIGIRYMQYREDIPRIKRLATSEEDYTREINKYKNATVLLIDDLYKSAIGRGQYGEYLNDADKRIMFEIINHRYFKGLPILISSECGMKQIIDLDEGVGSRILEMCKGHIVEIVGKENNYRLKA